MFAYLFPRTPNPPPSAKEFRFPPQMMKSLLAAQEREIDAYRRRLDKIHRDEKYRKENPSASAVEQDPFTVTVEVPPDSARDPERRYWERLNRIILRDDKGNLPPVAAPPNPKPAPENPGFVGFGACRDWLNDGERSEDSYPTVTSAPPSPLPDSPLTVEHFMEWLHCEEEQSTDNLSLVATPPNPDPVPASPVSEVHSIQDMEWLHRMFPDISPTTITKIVEHEFKPMDLAKLNPRRWGETFEDGCSLRDYPSLHSLLVPICLYFSVLQAGISAASGDAEMTRIVGEGGLRYAAHLVELEGLYQWPAVVTVPHAVPPQAPAGHGSR
ncbi:hypothetical protein MVEN_01933300 [Mycena venus]|uniref:Uncharacterized protein n=1 Tax=Mycena venus TaxID=2733690 RepID=A0A8H6XFD8_9AGAR|nr:hypothetical protein MVEN_01933300 [Mycena venus]